MSSSKKVSRPATSGVKENPGGGSKPMTIMQSVMSVEPAILIHMTSAILVFMTVQDVILEKACRVNLGYSDQVCDALQAR